MAILRKISYFLFWVIAIVLSAIVATVLALNLSFSFQEYVGKQVSKIASKELGVTINIERFSLSLPLNLAISNIYIDDFNGDKVLKSNELIVDLSTFRLRSSKFYFNEITSDTLRLVANKSASDSVWNYQKLIAEINKNIGGDSAESDAYFWFDLVQFNTVFLEINDSNSSKMFELHGLNCQNSFYSSDKFKVNLELESYGDNFKNKAENVALQFLMQDSSLILNDFEIDNAKSKLKIEQLKYVQSSDTVSSELVLKMPLLKVYQSEFPSLKELLGSFGVISATADVDGSFAQLNLNEFNMRLGTTSRLNVKGSLVDLRELETCFADVYVERSNVSAEDILRLKPFQTLGEEGEQILRSLNNVQFTGELVGFLNDFVAYGRFICPFGDLSTDLALRTQDSIPAFSGSISTNNFNVGNLLEKKGIGNLSLSIDLKGSGSNADNILANAKGKIKFVEVNGQRIEGITLDAKLSPNYFNGFIGLEDSLTFVSAKGQIDFAGKLPKYSLLLDVKEKDIRRFIDSSSVKLGVNLTAELIGAGFDYETIDASLNIQSLEFIDSVQTQNFNNTILSIYNSPLGKELRLSSSFINASVAGNLDPESITQSFLSLFPKTPWTTDDYVGRQDFSFTVNIDDNFPVQWLSGNSLFLANGSYLSGNWESTNSNYSLILQSDSVNYDGLALKRVNLFLETKSNIFSADIYASQLAKGGVLLSDLQVNLDYADSGKWSINAYNDFNNYFEAIGGYYHDVDSLTVDITTLEGQLIGKRLKNVGVGRLFADTSKLIARNFELSIENKPFSLDGLYSFEQGIKYLDFYAKSFDLAYLNQLSLVRPTLFGVGDLELLIDSSGKIEANVDFEKVKISDKSFGAFKALANYDYVNSNVLFDLSFTKLNEYKREELFTAKGKYVIDSGEIDGKVVFKDYNIRKLDRLFTDEVTNIKGLLDGELSLSGTVESIDLNGELSLSNANVHVDYLNADFIIPTSLVKIRPDFIGLDHINVTDTRGNKAYITGTGFHKNFSDWNFDVLLDANDFKLLNTSKYDNDLFYGVANVSGTVNASGYDDKLYFEMNVTPEKGTKIYLPMSDDTKVNDQEFVEFVKPPGADTTDQEKGSTWQGINLDLTVNANNNAEVSVVFDESAGDIMKVRGSGVLNFKIDRFGDFNARGKYIIEDGDYLFTLENVINKKFNIRNGSSIFWYGDPYKAILDVTAEYKLRVPLRDIVLIESERYNRREQVVAILKLQNELFNPDINFDIYLPNTDDLTRTQVRSVLRTQDEINRQVFSLLVFNRFSPPNSRQANGFTDASTATTTELLSNQLSNWFSQISSDVDIGFSYSGNKQTATARNSTELTNRQVAFALSTQLFNERLTLSTNLGVDQTSIDASTNPNNRFISDFALEYSLTKDGRLKLKAFSETAQGLYLANNLSNNIQGLGIYYRKDFNSFTEAWFNATKWLRTKKEE